MREWLLLLVLPLVLTLASGALLALVIKQITKLSTPSQGSSIRVEGVGKPTFHRTHDAADR
uniref:NADH dehydrogenase subunit 3 n=1 Tax=Peronospora matthiolae TaxID=2874970 RepID=A0AAV1U358_9STRA